MPMVPPLFLIVTIPKQFHIIKDPFHNRELIKQVCSGVKVIYIWTYLPTGICLVGSSCSSIDRVTSYFEPNLLLDSKARKALKFVADYGFQFIQLTIIPLDPKLYSISKVRMFPPVMRSTRSRAIFHRWT
uniref:Uncharacterized protein n=1 Tax=Wolfiporia cocos TaxID=81056 RepID=A0A7G7YDU9_9APHY|nr:hypothetical protein [Wolfiporia cocos]QNH92669.1 hypothetical protein [Wolfiporia cocos]